MPGLYCGRSMERGAIGTRAASSVKRTRCCSEQTIQTAALPLVATDSPLMPPELSPSPGSRLRPVFNTPSTYWKVLQPRVATSVMQVETPSPLQAQKPEKTSPSPCPSAQERPFLGAWTPRRATTMQPQRPKTALASRWTAPDNAEDPPMTIQIVAVSLRLPMPAVASVARMPQLAITSRIPRWMTEAAFSPCATERVLTS